MMRSKQKQQHQYFKSLSPRYPSSAVYLTSDKDPEQKLLKKINKLKHALKGAEKHNENLHAKIRMYRDGLKTQHNEMISNISREIEKQYSEKIKMVHHNYEIKIKQLEQKEILRIKTQKKINELASQLKQKDRKIIQLENINKNVTFSLQKQKQVVKNLESTISNMKFKDIQIQANKLKTLQKQIDIKNVQNCELNREISKLKQSLRESIYKADKMGLMTQSQISRNKQIEDQNKELKKIISVYQKQSKTSHQAIQNNKVQLLEYLQKIRQLQKGLLSSNFQLKKYQEQKQQIQQKQQKLLQQFHTLSSNYKELQYKYSQLVNNSYEAQRDLQRQLHTIVKQLTRRHIVSKSMINSTGSSIIMGSPNKQSERIGPYHTQDLH